MAVGFFQECGNDTKGPVCIAPCKTHIGPAVAGIAVGEPIPGCLVVWLFSCLVVCLSVVVFGYTHLPPFIVDCCPEIICLGVINDMSLVHAVNEGYAPLQVFCLSRFAIPLPCGFDLGVILHIVARGASGADSHY